MYDESLIFDEMPESDGEHSLLTVSGGDADSIPYTVIVEPDPRELELLEQISGSSQELLQYIQSQDDSVQLEYLRILAENSEDTDLLEVLQEVSESNQELLISNQRLELQMETGISILLIFMIVGLLHYIYKFLRMFF